MHELRICNQPMTSSLYEPNHAFCALFQNLDELMQAVKRVPIQTSKLEDIPEVAGAGRMPAVLRLIRQKHIGHHAQRAVRTLEDPNGIDRCRLAQRGWELLIL